MAAYVVRRLIQTFFVLCLITVICFLLVQIIPGDPAATLLGSFATQEQVVALRHELWLDRPVLVQYFHWVGNVLQGDFGQSIMYREPVVSLIAKRLPITIYLGLIAFIVSTVLGTLAGIVCAIRRGGFLDQAISILANLGIAAPQFWIGIMLIYIISLKMGLLPIQGFTSPFEDLWLSIKQIILPIFCLSVTSIAALARYARSAMLETIHQDYIRTAWSKGLREWVVITRHALKNALIPVVTMLGMRARVVFGGAVIVETVFNIPGMGRLLVRSVFDKDFLIVQAGVILMAIIVCFANLAVDISYGYLDPRIRYK
jgi:peptide/nickel transport system permease protein